MSEVKAIVRVGDTDLDGTKAVVYALARIKGIGISSAFAICRRLGVDPHATLGSLSEEQINKLDWAVRNLHEIAPAWFLNRRRDPVNGRDVHLIGSDLILAAKNDIDLMKKLRSWKGMRHAAGLKVRGQRTVTTGRFGPTAGVAKKKEAQPGGGAKQ
ncbi:MAG: 30S ribosomal protein S13 [Thermoproteus sp.]